MTSTNLLNLSYLPDTVITASQLDVIHFDGIFDISVNNIYDNGSSVVHCREDKDGLSLLLFSQEEVNVSPMEVIEPDEKEVNARPNNLSTFCITAKPRKPWTPDSDSKLFTKVINKVLEERKEAGVRRSKRILENSLIPLESKFRDGKQTKLNLSLSQSMLQLITSNKRSLFNILYC